MNASKVISMQKALNSFVEEFKTILGRSERRHWCQVYLSGLLMDGERKSIQAIANRLPNGNEQAMQQFIDQSPWGHHGMQLKLNSLLLRQFEPSSGALILDDTSLPKKGEHSVGVSRQYCGSLGKVANCQSLVTWHFANKKHHFPLLGELYLPKSWCEDKSRLVQKGVPESRHRFLKKWELALKMLDNTKDIPHEVIVFDAGFGEIREFLQAFDARQETFVGQIPESHSFWPADVVLKETKTKLGRSRRFPEVAIKDMKPLSARKWGELLTKNLKWKKISLPLASKPYTYALAIRVKEVTTQAYYRPGPERWLMIEKYGKNKLKYYVSNASPKTSLKQLIQWAHQRWKIEQGYQQLKEELGLDHFEGRSWRGLHHHVTLCFMAYAFLLLIGINLNKKNHKIYLAQYQKIS